MELSNVIQEFKKAYPNLSLETIEEIADQGTLVEVKKKDFLISRGDNQKKLGFVLKGLFRGMILKEDGEVTLWFSSEYDIIASYTNILMGQPAKITYQALEDAVVFVTSYDVIQKLSARNVSIALSINKMLEQLLLESFLRMEKFVLHNPEERYLQLLESKPEIINRVSQKLLASYIGITPVSLSRLRARLHSKKK